MEEKTYLMSGLTDKQKQLLEKEFKVNEHFVITRADYEDMPCPMMAWTWSDRQMEELAKAISNELCRYDENDPEGCEDDFWSTMENVAVRRGMQYYEDFGNEELERIEQEWNNVK